MEKVLFGDNQFFAVNHASDEKSRAQSIKFRKNEAIIQVLDDARSCGINTFMCTTHSRIAEITNHIRMNKSEYENFKIYPCMPYAHKYANAVTELGFTGALKEFVPGNVFSLAAKGGLAFVKQDYSKIMEILIDAEMKMFNGIKTPVIFLQNVLVDLLLGLNMESVFLDFENYVRDKYNAEPGYITMNMPKLVDSLDHLGIKNPIVCFSLNKLGFRVSGSINNYEKYLLQKEFRAIAMQVLAAGALNPDEAVEYVSKFKSVKSVLFGASTKSNIRQTTDLINKYII